MKRVASSMQFDACCEDMSSLAGLGHDEIWGRMLDRRCNLHVRLKILARGCAYATSIKQVYNKYITTILQLYNNFITTI